MKPHKWKNTVRFLCVYVCLSDFFSLIYGIETSESADKINIKHNSEDKTLGDVSTVSEFVSDENFLNDYLAENVVRVDENNLIQSDPVIQDISDEEALRLQLNRRRDVPDRGFSEKDKKRILDLHNLYRGNVTPPAGNMAFMEWDDKLEHLAQLWADGCDFRHGKPPNTSYPGVYGQNLYIGTDPSGYLGLWMWYEEYMHFDLRLHYCKPGEQCGHFIQLAWAPSKLLGCGIARCGLRYLIVCHYFPAAMRGVQMYDVAKPCSQCPPEDKALCLNNLCVSREQCERDPNICADATCNLKCLNCGKLNKTSCECLCADGWDSPDCSRICRDEHERCGVNPGFPSKASCSLNKQAVGKKHCRKMCGSCIPYNEKEKINHACCLGKICEHGYILDLHRNLCRCSLLCPGPYCDTWVGKGSVLEIYFVHVILQVLLVYYVTKLYF